MIRSILFFGLFIAALYFGRYFLVYPYVGYVHSHVTMFIENEVKPPTEKDINRILKPPEDHQYGEMGAPVFLPTNLTDEIKLLVDKGWEDHAFNQYVSDLISLHRNLPDVRDSWCKEPSRYLEDLPTTDVIICFHNEAWSTLVRTVHSVLERSPHDLIGEIILVDDFSDMRE